MFTLGVTQNDTEKQSQNIQKLGLKRLKMVEEEHSNFDEKIDVKKEMSKSVYVLTNQSYYLVYFRL